MPYIKDIDVVQNQQNWHKWLSLSELHLIIKTKEGEIMKSL